MIKWNDEWMKYILREHGTIVRQYGRTAVLQNTNKVKVVKSSGFVCSCVCVFCGYGLWLECEWWTYAYNGKVTVSQQFVAIMRLVPIGYLLQN